MAHVPLTVIYYWRSYHRGAYEQVIISAQRALTLATASRKGVLHALANHYLGIAYRAQGDYRRAIDYFRQAVAALDGAQRYERFGQMILPPRGAFLF